VPTAAGLAPGNPPRFLALVVIALLASGPPARARAPMAGEGDAVTATLCEIIAASARANGLPVAFFTRLIWQESGLRRNVTSPAGAQGIAQFMPGTAAMRGLANPFDPEQAIPESAKYLSELAAQFGNLGLAAAAYNAGPAQTGRWLAGQGELPLETQDYVLSITGRDALTWSKAGPAPPAAGEAYGPNRPCEAIVAALRRAAPQEQGASLFAPWGVQLAGNFSKALALAAFARAQDRYRAVIGAAEPFVLAGRLRSRGARAYFRVRLPAATRTQAEQLCGRIHAIGGSCIVLRS